MKIMLKNKEAIDKVMEAAKKACPDCTFSLAIVPLKNLTSEEKAELICEVMATGQVSVSSL